MTSASDASSPEDDPWGDLVEFYDGRFSIGLSAQEKSDLVAFLKAL